MRDLSVFEMRGIAGGEGDEVAQVVVTGSRDRDAFDMNDLLWNLGGEGGSSGSSDSYSISEGGSGNGGSPEPDKNADYAKQKAEEYNKAMDKWRADVAAEKVRAQAEADAKNAQYAAECSKLRFEAQNYIAGLFQIPALGGLLGDVGAKNSVLCQRVAVPEPRDIPMPNINDYK